MQTPALEIHPTLILVHRELNHPNTGFLAALNRKETPEDKTKFLDSCIKAIQGQPNTFELLDPTQNTPEKMFFMRLGLMTLVTQVTGDLQWYLDTKAKLDHEFKARKFNITFKGNTLYSLDTLKAQADSSFKRHPAFKYLMIGIVLFSMIKGTFSRNYSVPAQLYLSFACTAAICIVLGTQAALYAQHHKIAPFYSEDARRRRTEQRQNDIELLQFFCPNANMFQHLRPTR